jgi:pimeloyl-ACP methyl ester carboxylesterase
VTFVEVLGDTLEYIDIPGADPAFLLLHEGMGSISMWRDFPQELARATGKRVVAYSRAGFGRSSPRTRPWTPRFIHEEAFEVVPALRERLAIDRPVVLGHSTGASMALVHGSGDLPVAAVVAMAPLTDVEGSNVEAIRRAGELYRTTRWREKLARHHAGVDVNTVFQGWHDTWLRSDFRDWNIRADLARVRAPVLAILGTADEYSTPAQVETIRKNLPPGVPFEALILADCGHEPHRDQPQAVLEAVRRGLVAL